MATLEIQPQTLIIPEKDVYRLIMRSKLSRAEDFQDWVIDEVLPSIKKHGFYGTEDFVAKDVAAALGYANPREAIRDHCKYAESLRGSKTLPPEIQSQTVIIPEKDIYRLIIRSKLPAAEKVQNRLMKKSPAVSGIMSPICAITAIAAEVMVGHKKASLDLFFYCRPKNLDYGFMFKSFSVSRPCVLFVNPSVYGSFFLITLSEGIYKGVAMTSYVLVLVP